MKRNLLKDEYGRQIRKLRVSLLDTCNFRCMYCMPLDPKFMPRREWLTREEIVFIISHLTSMGLEEVRLTGGEPTLRKDLLKIASDISKLPLRKFGLTTNGYLLGHFLRDLKKTNCQHINISLDTLDRNKFERITKTDGLKKTLSSIFHAKELGFNVKLNTVIMRGINNDEIIEFVKFAEKHLIEVRFLELMSIGKAQDISSHGFVSADEITQQITTYTLLHKKQASPDSTSLQYITKNGGNIGVIAPVTRSFCHNCSRWRLTANGTLSACLMNTSGINLRGLSKIELTNAFLECLTQKPYIGNRNTPLMMHAVGG